MYFSSTAIVLSMAHIIRTRKLNRKEEAKCGASAAHKQKSDLEESTLGISNRAMKGVSTGSLTSSSNSAHRVPIPIQEDGMAMYFTALPTAKADESRLSSEKFAEGKRQHKVREAIEERKLVVEETKQKVALEDIALRKLKYDERNND
jgi:hypothetical protein